MTSNNGFKKQIRERMKLTGETYTEAYQHLKNQKPADIEQFFKPGMLSRTNPADSKMEDMFSFEEQELLRKASSSRNSTGLVVFSGKSGSGKTTTMNTALNTMNNSWSTGERVVIVEQGVQEIVHFQKPDNVEPTAVVSFLAADEEQLNRLIRKAIRMKPDRIILGEIRKPSFFMNDSLHHYLVLSTIHSPDFVHTLTKLNLYNDTSLDTLNVIVEQERFLKGDEYFYLHSVIALNTVVKDAVREFHVDGDADKLRQVVREQGMESLADKKRKFLKNGILQHGNTGYVMNPNLDVG